MSAREKKNLLGFTLAEVLITLMVIGVVASLTIPVVTRKVNEAQNKTAWKKSFSEFSQAITLAMGARDNLVGLFSGEDSFRDLIVNNMKYIQLCNTGTAAGPNACWHDQNSWHDYDGTPHISDFSDRSRAVLSNGTLVVFNMHTTNCDCIHTANDDVCADITIDINGFKGPNNISKDIFAAYILKDGTLLPFGAQADEEHTDCAGDSCGWPCMAELLYK